MSIWAREAASMISDWKQLPNAVRLEAGEVHVWLAALEADQTSRSLLSSDEQERANRSES